MSIAEVPIEVIPNGAAAREQQRPTQAGAGLRILTVSRLIARKDIDTLIRALARCRRTDLSLDIVGEGPRREQLAQLAFACGVADRVRFHGFMNRTRLDAMYGRADLFVLTSEAESCSMALLEAMAAGLPLVATKVGGTVELIESGHNGLLVEAGDAEQLGTALDRLAEDPAERERFSAANRALVRERFSWRSTARQYERVFEQALAQHAGASAQAAWGGGRERK
jgi:glycosyltransferase involved in cell wall biosynthesis